ncbi:MAG: SPOR domain-containing protein, partial [Sphingomonadales bacterium]|nr:SPOR domain-containing protein [Sphingomonadales bacterium]
AAVRAPAPHQEPPRPSFAEAFAQMAAPAIVDTAPTRGAVDLRHITPARAAPKPPPPPPPPAHPSRIWVELGVGRDYDRLGFDWRRMVKDDPALFRGRKPYVTGWVRTNRLLVGPFESASAADSFTARVRKAGHPTAFVWTSPAGQVVDPLETR